jgi:hypothetical protein
MSSSSSLRLRRKSTTSISQRLARSSRGSARSVPHLHRDWARPCHICAGTGAHSCRICTGAGLSIRPRLLRDWGSQLPHLHRDCKAPQVKPGSRSIRALLNQVRPPAACVQHPLLRIARAACELRATGPEANRPQRSSGYPVGTTEQAGWPRPLCRRSACRKHWQPTGRDSASSQTSLTLS